MKIAGQGEIDMHEKRRRRVDRCQVRVDGECSPKPRGSRPSRGRRVPRMRAQHATAFTFPTIFSSGTGGLASWFLLNCLGYVEEELSEQATINRHSWARSRERH